MKSVYLIGSLRNPEVPVMGRMLRINGFNVFDDWFAAGPRADDHWQEYEQARGRTFKEALLYGRAAGNVFRFDKSNLDRCDMAVLLMPAGKSGHMELGYFLGTGKPGFIYQPEPPDRWDVMYRFATGYTSDQRELLALLHGTPL